MRSLFSEFVSAGWTSVHRDQLASIVRATPAAMAGYAVNTTIALWAFHGLVPSRPLWIWAACAYAFSAYVGWRALRQRPPGSSKRSPLRSSRNVLASALLIALPWTVLTTSYAGKLDPFSEVVLIALAVGMAASGTILLAPVPAAALTYMTTILAPLAVKALFVLEGPTHLLLGALAVSYWFFLLALIRTKAVLIAERNKAVADLHSALSELRTSRAQTEQVAMTDGLTGLPNRRAFFAQLGAIDSAGLLAPDYCILFLDLNHFKAANDARGHAIGDKLLEAVAGRIKSGVRPTDFVGRLGGDEFGIIARGVKDRDLAEILAGRITTALSPPFLIEGHKFKIGASIGIALSSERQGHAEERLTHADMAMYRAKNGRSGVCFFEPDMLSSIEPAHGRQSHGSQ